MNILLFRHMCTNLCLQRITTEIFMFGKDEKFKNIIQLIRILDIDCSEILQLIRRLELVSSRCAYSANTHMISLE